MAQKLWNGADAAFNTPGNWSSPGTPQPGDTAIINAGTVTSAGLLPNPITLQLNSSSFSSPTLDLNGATIGRGTRVQVTSNASDAIVSVRGTVTNNGAMTFSGSRPVLKFGVNAAADSLVNQGGITVLGAGLQAAAAIGISQPFGIVNNGMISFRSTGAQQTNIAILPLTGTGRVLIGDKVSVELGSQVGAGQFVAFQPGLGSTSTLKLGDFAGFAGQIGGFAANDTVTGFSARWTNVTFAANSAGGVLRFNNAGGVVGALQFTGVYTALSDFNISQSAGTSSTALTTIHGAATLIEAAPRFTFSDTNTDVSGADSGTVYSGPVSYLQYQYLWQGNNDVVLFAKADSVFLRGGNGQDALKVQGGNNVLDGAGGSNFLIGATGADGGSDTFFVDGRGGEVTWSTLVNFHVGDALTIFGFTGGRSTLPFTDGDGAAGFTGATIHSELGGAGTGVNGSVTFAGFTVADVQAKFSIVTGNVGGIDYLQIANHG